MGAYREAKAESEATGARENATTVSVRARVDQEELSSEEEEEEDVISALDRNNQSTSAEPERGRTGRSEQESKGSQAKVDKSPQAVTTLSKGKATKGKPEFMAYDKAKHTIWAVPVSLILYRFAQWSTNARCSANDVRTIQMAALGQCSSSTVR